MRPQANHASFHLSLQSPAPCSCTPARGGTRTASCCAPAWAPSSRWHSTATTLGAQPPPSSWCVGEAGRRAGPRAASPLHLPLHRPAARARGGQGRRIARLALQSSPCPCSPHHRPHPPHVPGGAQGQSARQVCLGPVCGRAAAGPGGAQPAAADPVLRVRPAQPVCSQRGQQLLGERYAGRGLPVPPTVLLGGTPGRSLQLAACSAACQLPGSPDALTAHACPPAHPLAPPAGKEDFWCSRACAAGDAERYEVSRFWNSPRAGKCAAGSWPRRERSMARCRQPLTVPPPACPPACLLRRVWLRRPGGGGG